MIDIDHYIKPNNLTCSFITDCVYQLYTSMKMGDDIRLLQKKVHHSGSWASPKERRVNMQLSSHTRHLLHMVCCQTSNYDIFL